jgi:hypothetical protein
MFYNIGSRLEKLLRGKCTKLFGLVISDEGKNNNFDRKKMSSLFGLITSDKEENLIKTVRENALAYLAS